MLASETGGMTDVPVVWLLGVNDDNPVRGNLSQQLQYSMAGAPLVLASSPTYKITSDVHGAVAFWLGRNGNEFHEQQMLAFMQTSPENMLRTAVGIHPRYKHRGLLHSSIQKIAREHFGTHGSYFDIRRGKMFPVHDFSTPFLRDVAGIVDMIIDTPYN